MGRPAIEFAFAHIIEPFRDLVRGHEFTSPGSEELIAELTALVKGQTRLPNLEGATEHREPWQNVTLYIVHLDPDDYERVQKGHVGYSGATGSSARYDVSGYKYGAYIASYFSELPKALHALEWKHPRLIREHDWWVLSKGEPESSSSILLKDAEQDLQFAIAEGGLSPAHERMIDAMQTILAYLALQKE